MAHAISSSRHVRATVFLDQELQFIDEHDYPGVSELRKKITAAFAEDQVSSIPHTEVMARINEAGKTFRILFIKTTGTIPYTSVYMRLDCGYMNDEVERKIGTAMAAARQPANRNSRRLGKIRFIACKTTGYFNEPSKISRHIGRNIHAMRLAWQRLL